MRALFIMAICCILCLGVGSIAEEPTPAPQVHPGPVMMLMFLSERETHIAHEILLQGLERPLTSEDVNNMSQHIRLAEKYRDAAIEALGYKGT